MLPFVALASGWVTISQSRFGAQIDGIRAQLRGQTTNAEPNIQQKLGYLWTKPASSDDTSGLGGGITWQWDPDLCGSLLPRLHRSQLFTCDDLKAATRRAFTTWASNHKDIRFVDVTEQCAAIGQPHEGCELAEVWVTVLALDSTASQDTEGMSASTASPRARVSNNFRYTNGERAYMLQELGTFSAEDGDDETIFATNADGAAAITRLGTALAIEGGELVVGGMSYAVEWTGGVPPADGADNVLTVAEKGVDESNVGLLVTLAGGGSFANPERKRGLQVIETFGATLSLNPEVCWHLDDALCAAVSAGSVCGLPPDEADVQACSSCFSFQVAMLHEAGHVLGLSHPDRASEEVCTSASYCGPPGENSYSTGLSVARMNATSCKSPWDDVQAGIPPGAAVDPQTGVRPSVMTKFTSASALLCLQQDDVEALHVLYPDCTYARQAPLCEPLPMFTCPSTAPMAGCTYPSAGNYDASVTVDDGSCVFDCIADAGASCGAVDMCTGQAGHCRRLFSTRPVTTTHKVEVSIRVNGGTSSLDEAAREAIAAHFAGKLGLAVEDVAVAFNGDFITVTAAMANEQDAVAKTAALEALLATTGRTATELNAALASTAVGAVEVSQPPEVSRTSQLAVISNDLPPPSSPEPGTAGEPSTDTAIIVGGAVAGVAIVCLTILVVVRTLAVQKTRQLSAGTSSTSSATSAGEGTSTSTVHVERLWL